MNFRIGQSCSQYMMLYLIVAMKFDVQIFRRLCWPLDGSSIIPRISLIRMFSFLSFPLKGICFSFSKCRNWAFDSLSILFWNFTPLVSVTSSVLVASYSACPLLVPAVSSTCFSPSNARPMNKSTKVSGGGGAHEGYPAGDLLDRNRHGQWQL